jgi:RHS repeat-associated protein
MHKALSRKLGITLLASSALIIPAQALAQSTPPKFISPDDHGVDLTSGLPFFQFEEGGIGSGKGRVAMQRIWAAGAGMVDNWTGGLYPVTSGTTKMYVRIGGISDTFSGSGSSWTADKADGATLTVQGDGTWLYTSRDGTKIVFVATADDDTIRADYSDSCPGADPGTCQYPLSITQPDGMKFTLTWGNIAHCVPFGGDPCGIIQHFHRFKTATSSAGYSLTVNYASGLFGDDWFRRTSVTFNNSANPPSPVPTISYSNPDAATVNITDPGGNVWRISTLGGPLAGIRRPGSATDNITYAYGGDGTVNSAMRDGVTNTYARSVVGTTATETVTNPLSKQVVVVSDLTKGRPTSYKDELNRTTGYQYDANARLMRVTQPEGNYVQYGYDARGNVQTMTNVAKSGSGLANIVSSASFDATCTNVVKCNKPNTTTDPKGNVTNYTYDPTHGGITSFKQPAPAVGGIRPETRSSYTQVTSASGDLVYMLTGVSACQTTASCTGLLDETKVTAGYNSNLLPTTVTRANGTGALTATSTLTYYSTGTLNTVDGPLSGTADTTKYRYDGNDLLVGVTSPDPDGASAMKMRAIKLTYRGDRQISKQELGTVNSQSDPDWALFAPLQTIDITFDANSRVATRKLSSGATAYALTQTTYDSLGRLDCSAVRMNTAVYGSLPASACSLSTQGSFGPDRINQLVYSDASEITQNNVGVATTDAATERTLTYNANGTLATVKDAENNLTTYEYDGFDRLSKTRYPNSPKGAGTSSTSDYEQLLSYDANSNPGSRRLRDTTSIAFTYDNLNRVTLKNLPGTEPDVSYGYDNLGRMTSANQTGNNLTFNWDALSRKTSEAVTANSITLTTNFGYDLANRRTSIAYPTATALTIDYAYLVTGELDTIKQSTTVLADYAYDNLGNRTGATFNNGASQAFAYDPVSRLSQLTNVLTDSNDLTATFAYNPASQITSTVRTGDMYAWTGHGNGSTAFVQNGLNQQTSIGGVPATWDNKGNLTTEPQSGKTYGYSSENLLTSATGGVALAYDPALRLYQTVSGATTTRFLYDGTDAIAEYNGSNALQRRFVFDPTTGQPVLWYEGTGTLLTNRRYLSTDERGSVISVSGSTGTSLGINTYDEYGKPGSANLGRYQYTGQKWIGEANVYDYHLRDYVAHLGIFAQTDPIGQADSPNLYAYVLDDPVNLIDPLGFCSEVEQDGGAGSDCPIVITGSKCPSGWVCVSGTGVYDVIAQLNQLGQETQIVITGSKKKPPPRAKPEPGYCTSQLYQFADAVDKIGAYAQGAVLAGGLAGKAEPYAVARAAFGKGAAAAYEYIGFARLGANVVKAAYGDYGHSIKDVGLNVLGKAVGGDALIKSLGEFGIDIGSDVFIQSPC